MQCLIAKRGNEAIDAAGGDLEAPVAGTLNTGRFVDSDHPNRFNNIAAQTLHEEVCAYVARTDNDGFKLFAHDEFSLNKLTADGAGCETFARQRERHFIAGDYRL